MNPLRLLGRAKYRFVRIVSYVHLFNTSLLIYLAGWNWWYLLLAPGVLLIYYFEMKHGIPGELDVAWGSSKEWQEFRVKFNQFLEKYEADKQLFRDSLRRAGGQGRGKLQQRSKSKNSKRVHRSRPVETEDLRHRPEQRFWSPSGD